MSKQELTVEQYAALVGELNNKIKVLEDSNKAQAASIKTLEANATSQAKTIEALTGQKLNLETKVKTLTDANTSATEIITDLKGKVNEASKLVENTDIEKGIISHKGKQYKLLSKRFKHEGQVYEPKDVQGNTQLIAELLQADAGVLKPL